MEFFENYIRNLNETEDVHDAASLFRLISVELEGLMEGVQNNNGLTANQEALLNELINDLDIAVRREYQIVREIEQEQKELNNMAQELSCPHATGRI